MFHNAHKIINIYLKMNVLVLVWIQKINLLKFKRVIIYVLRIVMEMLGMKIKIINKFVVIKSNVKEIK